jgi:hypothetical protein
MEQIPGLTIDRISLLNRRKPESQLKEELIIKTHGQKTPIHC